MHFGCSTSKYVLIKKYDDDESYIASKKIYISGKLWLQVSPYFICEVSGLLILKSFHNQTIFGFK